MTTKYGPALVAVLFAILTAVASAITDNHITEVEWVQVAIQGTTVAGVWLVPAFPRYPHVKAAVAVLLAVLNLLVTVITDGISPAELINLLVAGVGVLAVRFTPPPIHAANERAGPPAGEIL